MDNKNYLSNEEIKNDIILEENKKEFRLVKEKKQQNKEERKKFLKHVIIIYVVTLIIFPSIIGLLFQNISIDLRLSQIDGNYDRVRFNVRIFFLVFFIFDIIFTFLILRKHEIDLKKLIMFVAFTPAISCIYFICNVILFQKLETVELEAIIYNLLERALLGKALVGHIYSYGICLGAILAKIFNKKKKAV